ncbi:MAG: hypothetical protein AAF927_26560 [Bacteroidota bacterium]
MPANKKYLLQSPWAKTSKVIAAILGSLIGSVLVHLALALWIDKSTMLNVSVYGIFMLWVGLMLLVYWVKSPWKSWGVLLTIISLAGLLIYLGKL